MENFDWTSFTKRIPIKTSVAEIYDAWTKPSEIITWFLSAAKYTNAKGDVLNNDLSVEEGHLYNWSWYTYDVLEKGKILIANGKDHIRFTFAGDTIVDVHLNKKGSYVVVELTQRGIPTDSTSKKDIRLGCESGWSFFLVNLKSIYEGGIDLRNKQKSFKGMLNH